jgi:hypothetical protein
MIACLLSCVVGSRPVEFGTKPPSEELEIGRAVYRSGAGIDRTLMADRVVLGTWFDGRIRRTVDTATWLSPELAARWFGYLAERDAWSDETLVKKWQEAEKELNGTLTFMVRLSAFPKLDPFEFGVGAPPKPETLQGVKIRLSFHSTDMHTEKGFVLTNDRLVAVATPKPFMFEKESVAAVLGRPFFSFTKFSSLFLGDGEVDAPDDGIPLGDYYGAVYVAQFPALPSISSAQKFELAIQLPSKREKAHFDLFPAVNPSSKRNDLDD